MVLQQIYSGNGLPNFIRIARVLWRIIDNLLSYCRNEADMY